MGFKSYQKEENFGNNQAFIRDYKKLSALYSHKTKSDLRDVSKKVLLPLVSKSILPEFSSRSFTVSTLTFRFLIHLEFVFVYGVRDDL